MTHRRIDPRAMSDDELRAICAPRRWEAELERVGCLIALVLAILAVVGVVRFLRLDTGAFGLVETGAFTFVATAAGSGAWFLVLAGAPPATLSCRAGPALRPGAAA